jgi:urease accessory protein
MSQSSVSSSLLAAAFAANGGHTQVERLHESGALRLRRTRDDACEASIVNTGGGIVGGDRIALDVRLGRSADVTITSVAAEKIYRAAGAAARLETRLTLGGGARLDWLPQETILFDGARLDRRFSVDIAADATLLAAEMVVFGRLASAETSIAGSFRDGWRVRRDGALVFADETRLDGAIGTILDRPAVGGGARAAALLLLVAPEAESLLEPARAALEPHRRTVEGGASARDRLLAVRLLSRDPERLRAAAIAVLGRLRAARLPRAWG